MNNNLPQDLKHFGRRVEDSRNFCDVLLVIIAASGFIGYVIGFLSR
jgi:hypothetical protein